MRALFADVPEAVDNTLVIARAAPSCREAQADPAAVPARRRPTRNPLARHGGQGLERRLRSPGLDRGHGRRRACGRGQPYRERLEYELDVIARWAFPAIS
jgi:DNA polymerase-3 subunit alpha